MPAPSLKPMARKAGVSLDAAERYWREAKRSAEDQGLSEGDDDFYAYTMGIVKRRMGLAGILRVEAALDVDRIMLDAYDADAADVGYFDNWERNVKKALGGKRLKKIGYGSFADVYQHPTDGNKVVKVVRYRDWCWAVFVDFINDTTDRQQRKYLPTIHNMNAASLYDDNEGSGVYIMEKLRPWSTSIIKKSARLDRIPFMSMMQLWDGRNVRYTLPHDAMLRVLGVEREDDDDFYDDLEADLEAAKDDGHPFIEILEELGHRCRLDLAEENIMFRQNGQLVLNDPVADGRA